MTSRRLSLLALTLTAFAGSAWADRNITVDGSDTDWTGATTCITGNIGTQGIILDRLCFENNNTTGNTGNMYVLLESTATLPTNADTYFGFGVDTNNDGVLDGNDEVYAVYFPAGSTVTTAAALLVYPYNSYFGAPKRTYTNLADCGGSTGANGWVAKRAGKNVEISIAYGCMALSSCNDSRIVIGGAYPELNASGQYLYNGSQDVLTTLASATPDAKFFTAVSGSGKLTFNWNNPAQHGGVLVLRSTSAFTTTPSNGTTYTVGQQLGGSSGPKVAYADNASCASTFTDTGLTNGQGYYYRVYNFAQSHKYATGAVPTSSGLYAEPTSRVNPSPLSCYSVGTANLQQPVTLSNTAVFTSGNVGAVTATQTSSSASVDGQELWRPVELSGSVQSRFPVVPLHNRSGYYLLSGDQGGSACVLNAATGAAVWSPSCKSIATSIQAQAGVQLYDYSNSLFQSAQPGRDLIFFGTRNSSATTNKVYALSSVDGSNPWTYPTANNLDIINGGMLVDYTANHLWVAARSNSNTQASVRVIDTRNGGEVTTFSLGDVDYGVNEDFTSKQAYIVTNAGKVYGIDLATLAVKWSYQLANGATTSYVFPTGNGFIASLKTGTVERYSVSGTTVTKLWSTAIATPSGVTVQYTTNKIFVGSSDKKIHQLNADTGVDEKQVTLTSQTGMPTIDATALRVSAGTLDGRLCTYGLPW